MSEEIKNILHKKFEDFEPKPTRDLWAGIEAEIQPRRRVAAAWWYAAAAAVAILIAVVLWPSVTGTDTPSQIASTTEEVVPPVEIPKAIQPTLSSDDPQNTKPETRNSELEARNPKRRTTNATNSKKRSLPIQPKTPLETKEAKPRIQLMAIASPTPTTILVAEAIPGKVDLQKISVTPEKKDRPSLKDLDLTQLNPVNMVSFASEKLDAWGVHSPIHYQQQAEKSRNQTKSRFQLVLGKLSITHTSHKPI